MSEAKPNSLRIGGGSAYANDRVEPALQLARDGGLDYLCFDSLAERTLALAQQRKQADPTKGYDVRTADLMSQVLPVAVENGVKLIGSMGAANPEAAADLVAHLAKDLGLHGLRIACVTGDDVLDTVRAQGVQLAEDGRLVREIDNVISANAYLGAAPIVEALEEGADVVITGRVADPSLFLAPMMHEFGWAEDAWELKGAGQTIGHLIECAGYVTGAHYADPPYRVVPGLSHLGFPLAEVNADGTAVITKLPGTGGLVSVNTCKAQLVYEIHDPRNYLTPDVNVDVSGVTFAQLGPDRVAVQGATGREWPETLKVLVGLPDGFVWEGEISYSGTTAMACAELAREYLEERIEASGKAAAIKRHRFDLIGMNSANQAGTPRDVPTPYEVRLRFAGLTEDRELAELMAQEVEWLFMGPNGGGGVRKSVRPTLGMYSAYLPRDAVSPQVSIVNVP